MDETALLALGLLMEEVCRDALGETGDMVFTERELKNNTQTYDSASEGGKFETVKAQDATATFRTRSGKRRKLDPTPAQTK
jgi:hypothetical protein